MSYATTRVLVIGVLALMSLVGGGTRGLVQDPAPAAADDAALPHPAHIHTGSCASLDPDPRFPLGDATIGTADGGMAGAETAIPVATSATTLDVKLDELLEAPYAIAVHESAENLDDYVACGDLGGTIVGADLAIGLKEQHESGLAGIAWLRADGDKITVTVFLAQGLGGPASGADDTQPTQAQVTFYVETVTCPGCQLRVEGGLQKAPGILDVAWEGQQVTVTYDPSQVSPEQILAAIEEGGDTAYEVTDEDED